MQPQPWTIDTPLTQWQEHPLPRWLWPLVDEVWCADPSPDPSLILPDNGMDLLWIQNQWWIAGPATHAYLTRSAHQGFAWGVRFIAGALPLITGWDARDFVDRVIPLSDITHSDILKPAQEKLMASETQAHLTLLKAMSHNQARRVDTLAHNLGWSTRQLRRKLSPLLGYSPKTWLRIEALRTVVAKLHTTNLAQLAFEVGYSDQAHMSHACRALTGLTPTQLRAVLEKDDRSA